MLTVNTRITTENLIEYIKSNIEQFNLNLTNEQLSCPTDDTDNYAITVNLNFFPLKANLNTKIDLIGNNLDDILSEINDDFYRIGVLSNINDLEDVDISLYSSILWLLKDGFSNYKNKKQSEYIYEFIKTVKLDSQTDLFDKFCYKSMGWTKTQLLEDIKSEDIKTTVIRYLADYLHVNIFILNVLDGKVYYSGSDGWITYKKNLLLIKHKNNNFEPVYTPTTKFFTTSSKLVSYLLTKPYVVNILQCNFKESTENEFGEESEELDKYISKQTEIVEESETINKFDDDSSDGENSEQKEIDYTTMSYVQLKKIAIEYDINLYFLKDGKKKKKSKSMIIKDIQKNVNKPDYSNYKVLQLRELALECGLVIKDGKKYKVKSILLEELDEYFS